MSLKVDFQEDNVYTTFEKRLKKALKDNNHRELLALKIVDFSLYRDKHFKSYRIEPDSPSDKKSHDGIEKYLPTFGDITKAFSYNTPNKEDKRNGLIIIPQCLTVVQQVFWSHHIMRDLLSPTVCKTNLPENLFTENLYEQFVKETRPGKSKTYAKKKMSALKWASYGYHIDWEKMEYHQNSSGVEGTGHFSPYPASLALLASHIARSVLQAGVAGKKPFYPETSIVHFHTELDRVAGHKRDIEPDQAAPIISLSLLNDAVILVGGETKDAKPMAIRLKSGDVMIATGTSRHCVQGVTRVLSNTVSSNVLEGLIDRTLNSLSSGGNRDDVTGAVCDGEDAAAEEANDALKEYFRNLRIHIQHRQVFPKRNEMTHQFYFLKNHELSYY